MLKTDGLFAGCFGTADPSLFDKTFKKIYNTLTSKAKVASALALLNHGFARKLNEKNIDEASMVLKSCENVLAVPMFMADGNTYQLFKDYCEKKGYILKKPVLEEHGKEVADVLNSMFPHQKNTRIILLAHGSREYDNHEYHELSKLLREDFTIVLSEAGESIDDCIKNCREENIILYTLMFCAGHHFKHEAITFVENCRINNKNGKVYESSLGENEDFIKIFEKYLEV